MDQLGWQAPDLLQVAYPAQGPPEGAGGGVCLDCGVEAFILAASTHFGRAAVLRAQRGPAESIRTHSDSLYPAMVLAAFTKLGVLIPRPQTINFISSSLTPAARAR